MEVDVVSPSYRTLRSYNMNSKRPRSPDTESHSDRPTVRDLALEPFQP